MTFEQMFYIFIGWAWLIALVRAISVQLLYVFDKNVDARKEWAFCIVWMLLTILASHLYDGPQLSEIVLH